MTWSHLPHQTLASVTVAGVSMALFFLIGRVLGPEAFGAWNVVFTWAALGMLLVDGGFRVLIFREGAGGNLRERILDVAFGHWLFFPGLPGFGAVAFVLVNVAVVFRSSWLKAEGRFREDAGWQVQCRLLSAGMVAVVLLVQKDYFLSTARLEPLKRVDRIVRAFLDMPDQHLVVASGGSQERQLRKMAGDAHNIRFTGWISDRELADLMGHARASIYVAEDEDFGMSPVESMAAGKPVIGVAEGGLLETVIDGETGSLLPPNPTPENLIHAVRHMTPAHASPMRHLCQNQARKFTTDTFIQSIRGRINWGRTGIND